MLAACGASSRTTSSEPAAPAAQAATPEPTALPSTPTAAQATAQPSQPAQVTLRWFMRWDKTRVDTVAKPIITAFEQSHPQIKISFENVAASSEYQTKLAKSIAEGTAPDVIYPLTHQITSLVDDGALLNLNPYIQQDKLDLSKYEPAVLDLYQINQQFYALPTDTAAMVVAYNKQMFDQAHVPYPSDTWTWDDFLQTAQKLTVDSNGDGKTDQFGVDSWTSYWPLIIWSQAGHAVFDNPHKPTAFLLDDPKATAALQWLADLTLKHHVMPSSAERGDITDMFVAQKAAMKLIGHWQIPQMLKNATDIQWDVAALPHGQLAVNRMDGSGYAIATQSKHPKEAWEFLKFLAGPDAEGAGMFVDLQQMTPALTDLQHSDRFLKPANVPALHKEAFLAGRDHLFPLYDPISPLYDAINQIESDALKKVWAGDLSAKDAVEQMKPGISHILETQ